MVPTALPLPTAAPTAAPVAAPTVSACVAHPPMPASDTKKLSTIPDLDISVSLKIEMNDSTD
jgi:hypothetical protein